MSREHFFLSFIMQAKFDNYKRAFKALNMLQKYIFIF